MMVSSLNVASINYEAQYNPAPLVTPNPNLKRRNFADLHGGGDKRQRIEPTSHDLRPHHSHHLIQQSSFSPYYNPNNPSVSDPIYNPASLTGDSQFNMDPHLNMRIYSLNILESLALQILETLSRGSLVRTIKIVTEPQSELGQTYATVKSLFAQTKKIYTQQDIFLSADKLNIRDPTHKAIIRTTNFAIFVSGLFAGEIGFEDLNSNFLEVFVPAGEYLSKEQGELFLHLKMQMYIAAHLQENLEGNSVDILKDIYSSNEKQHLISLHPDEPLQKSEIDFINKLQDHSRYLKSQTIDLDFMQKLTDLYPWEDLLQELVEYIRVAYGPKLASFMTQHPSTHPSDNTDIEETRQETEREAERAFRKTLRNFIRQNRASSQNVIREVHQNLLKSRNDSSSNQSQKSESKRTQNEPQTGTKHEFSPPPNQTEPTEVLYEKARQATMAKPQAASPRRPDQPNQRRPWSPEEEKQLIMGLDQVKGPHWSQILSLFGAEGSINHVLKDRNQVQLKDKARNLKLFFLKSNTEVPHFLQSVTGDLKTRAPTQAAKKEAEERARLATAEEQTRVDGIMALSNIKGGSKTEKSAEDYPSSSSDVTLASYQDLNDEMTVESDEEKLDSKNPHHNADGSLNQDIDQAAREGAHT